VNCTIVDNTVIIEAGGLRNCDESATITNCIIWGNDPCQLVDSSTPTYSCIEDWSGGGTGNINSDPCFVDSANDDYHIQPISPCINEGDPCDPCEPYVIDGGSRVFNGTVDMGADEFNGVIYVDAGATGGNDNGGSWANAYIDLQDALETAGSGVEIWVAEGTYYPTGGTTRTISFELKSGVDLYGGFDPCSGDDLWSERDWAGNVTILSGDIDEDSTPDSDNSYNVVVGATGATLDGFTITMGYADHASTFQYQCGGGMWNEDVSPTITNCIFMDNEAYFGGGMFNDSASPTIKNCLFADNTARTADVGIAGAIFCYDYSDAAIENCTITQNTANYFGGGIVADSYSDPQISNSIIVYNQDSFGYSDIDAYGNSTVIVNYSDYDILYADGAAITPQNCISVAPEFADAGNDDFHLKSEIGRWNGSSWVTDGVTSPCINAGDPASGCSLERENNGDRINMGFYGNTSEASKSDLYPFSYLLETNDIYSLPTEAAWSISGGSVNMSDLASDEIIMIPAGSYTISFECDNSTPYISPADQNKTVTSSTVNYYTATYQACGALQISAFCPATLGYGSSAWGRFSCDGGSTWNIPYNCIPDYVKVLPDSYTIEFEDYSLLNTPDDITDVTVSAYNVVQIIRTYLLNDVYVEPVSGNDSNIGTSASPVATVTNAATKVKISGTVYVTNYETYFWHQDAQEYRGRITENVSLGKPVIIRYTGPYSFVHITGSHTLSPYPTLVGVILD